MHTTKDNDEYIDFGFFFRSIWKSKIKILGISFLLSALVVGYAHFFMEKLYRSETVIASTLGSPGIDFLGDNLEDSLNYSEIFSWKFQKNNVEIMARVLDSQDLIMGVVSSNKQKFFKNFPNIKSVSQIAKEVRKNVRVEGVAPFVQVEYRHADAKFSADFLNMLLVSLDKFYLKNEVSVGKPGKSFFVIETPRTPVDQYYPNLIFYALLSFFTVLLVSSVVFAIKEYCEE